MAKKRPAKKQIGTNGAKVAFFIRRKSHVDDTEYFSDDGRRVFFEKATWVAFLLPQFKPDQKARVVRDEVRSGDVPYQRYLLGVLPRNVTIKEYLAMVEEMVRERMKGKGLSNRKARAFLRHQEALYGNKAT